MKSNLKYIKAAIYVVIAVCPLVLKAQDAATTESTTTTKEVVKSTFENAVLINT